jgi:hypothetical protein
MSVSIECCKGNWDDSNSQSKKSVKSHKAPGPTIRTGKANGLKGELLGRIFPDLRGNFSQYNLFLMPCSSTMPILE